MKIPEGRIVPHFGFSVAAVVFVVLGWTVYSATIREHESAYRLHHALNILLTISNINEALARAESDQRGYLLSGSDTYLRKRDELLAKLSDGIVQLKDLLSDNPAQQRRVPQLEALIAARIALMHETARLRQTEGLDIARSRVASGIGQRASARIYALTEKFRQEALRLTELRRSNLQRGEVQMLATLISAALLAVIILIPAYIGYIRQNGKRDRAERKLLDMADSVPGAVVQCRLRPGRNWRYEFVSSGAEALRGVSRAAALADFNTVWESVLDEDKPGFSAAITTATQTLTPIQHEFRVKHPNGELKWLRSTASLRQESDGSILMTGHWGDITEQKRLQYALHEAKEAAESASRAKSSFLATMSHEIRTPMNGLLGMLELLGLAGLSGEQRTTLEIVRESAKSLLRIIDDILDFSKIEAGRLDVRPEVVSIADVIDAGHSIYAGTASSKGVLLKRSVDPRISPAVWVDPLRLRQILNNFVSNALKFTAQGYIEIKAELVERLDGEDRVRFSVTDTGIGISPAQQQHLFQPFSQADGETASRFGGTGLGLTICRRLAALMGGSVEMVSELGKGTTMSLTLTLPIADPKDLAKPDPDSEQDLFNTILSRRRVAPSVAEAETEGTLVLLVDDHPTNRLVLMRQLNTLGYAAESAEDGSAALTKWQSGRFAAVVTDCNMPEMDGYELARSIRDFESRNGGTRTPIIACTAKALVGEAELCFAAGMDDYLSKPVEMSQLLTKLEQWLPIPNAGAAPRNASASHSAAPTAGAAIPIDRSALGGISGGDPAAERDILMDFRHANDAEATALEHAVGQRDIAQVTRASHRIKGASGMIGAMGLARVCECIEHASRSDDWATVEANLGAFREELLRLNTYLNALRIVPDDGRGEVQSMATQGGERNADQRLAVSGRRRP